MKPATKWLVYRIEHDSWQRVTVETFLGEFSCRADAMMFTGQHMAQHRGEDIVVREIPDGVWR